MTEICSAPSGQVRCGRQARAGAAPAGQPSEHEVVGDRFVAAEQRDRQVRLAVAIDVGADHGEAAGGVEAQLAGLAGEGGAADEAEGGVAVAGIAVGVDSGQVELVAVREVGDDVAAVEAGAGVESRGVAAVGAAAPDQRVGARAALDPVGAVAADQPIGAGAPAQRVVAAQATQDVAAAVAGQRVAEAAAMDGLDVAGDDVARGAAAMVPAWVARLIETAASLSA